MKEPWTHHVRVVNGFRMHYVIAGSGPALVLLHGWPQSWYEWRNVIPALAERFTVVAPDLRGLGDSAKPIGGYDKRTLATDVRDGWTGTSSTGGDNLYLPDKNGTKFLVQAYERIRFGGGNDYRRVYLMRQSVTWPSDNL